jgi:hypothetical protein
MSESWEDPLSYQRKQIALRAISLALVKTRHGNSWLHLENTDPGEIMNYFLAIEQTPLGKSHGPFGTRDIARIYRANN